MSWAETIFYLLLLDLPVPTISALTGKTPNYIGVVRFRLRRRHLLPEFPHANPSP